MHACTRVRSMSNIHACHPGCDRCLVSGEHFSHMRLAETALAAVTVLLLVCAAGWYRALQAPPAAAHSDSARAADADDDGPKRVTAAGYAALVDRLDGLQ